MTSDISTTLSPYGRRRGPPLNELAAHRRAICEHLGVRYLAQGYLGGALKVSRYVPYDPYDLPSSASQPSPLQTELPRPDF